MESNSVNALMAALSETPLAPLVVYLPLVMGVAALLATVLPRPQPGSPWAPARAALDLVAMNFGQATNAKLPKPPPETPPKTGT